MAPSERIYMRQTDHWRAVETAYELGYAMAVADCAAGVRLTADEVADMLALDLDAADGYATGCADWGVA